MGAGRSKQAVGTSIGQVKLFDARTGEPVHAPDCQGTAEIRHVEGYLAFWDELPTGSTGKDARATQPRREST
jgi:hypothetical protein